MSNPYGAPDYIERVMAGGNLPPLLQAVVLLGPVRVQWVGDVANNLRLATPVCWSLDGQHVSLMDMLAAAGLKDSSI